MPSELSSDLQLDTHGFRTNAISEKTKEWNATLIKVCEQGPRWWEVGAAKYRQMRWNGETAWPKPIVLDRGKDIEVPSRDPARSIPCRVFTPERGDAKGVFLHIHGGGWVLNTQHYQDSLLDAYSKSGLTVVSIGYRKAPENPYPAANEDCLDAAEHLIDHAEKTFGAPVKFMGGDSAGGHLSVLTCFKLLETRPQFAFKGLVLAYGAFEIAGMLPQVWQFDMPLILEKTIMQKFIEAYLPGRSIEERQDPLISPFFADLNKMKLPPALFLCGTLDPLLDDSVLFSAKWAMSGAESILKIYPGAAHGFTIFPVGKTETTEQGLNDIAQFLDARNSSD